MLSESVSLSNTDTLKDSMSASIYCNCGMQEDLHVSLFLQKEPACVSSCSLPNASHSDVYSQKKEFAFRAANSFLFWLK